MQKHPNGIYHLFLTELWERFSYYGITSLLILYVRNNISLSENKSYLIYGTYGTLVYTTPIAGGWLADRFLGQYRATLWGAIVIALGHFVMMIPDDNHEFFYLGLAFVIMGTGLFKPNVANLVSSLYEKTPAIRESGFRLAHVGCNIGTIIAPIFCAYIATKTSYSIAFGVAGIGMLLGVFTLLRGRINFQEENRPLHVLLIAMGFGLTLITIIQQLFKYVTVASYGVSIAGITTLVMIARTVSRSARHERTNMLYAIGLLGVYLIFMTFLQISGGPLNLFTDQYVDRMWLGVLIPTGAFQSVEPLAVVLLGILSLLFWKKTPEAGGYTCFLLFVSSLLFQALSFFVLSIGIHFDGAQGIISMSWLNVAYVLQASGELLIAPIGLAMIAEWVPRKCLGIFMGAWVLVSGYANFIASRLGIMITSGDESPTSMASYLQLFESMATFAVSSAFALLLGMLWFRGRAR